MKFTAFGTIFTRIFIFFLGLLLVLSAANKIYTYCDFRFFGGMVYGIIDHPSSSRDIGGRPLIQYTDPEGGVHEFKSRAKTHWFHTPRKGEKIKVFIHGKDPQRAIVDNWFYYIFLPLVFLGAGSYCCLYTFRRASENRPDKLEAAS